MNFSWISKKDGQKEDRDEEERRRLERELKAHTKALSKAEKQIDELRKSRDDAESRYQQAMNQNKILVMQYDNKIASMTMQYTENTKNAQNEHARSIDSWQRKYNSDTESLRNKYSRDVGSLRLKQAREVEITQTQHKRDFQELKMKHENEVSQLKEEMSKLIGQLLVNQDDDQGWPDDKLKINFRELQRLIESVTAPRNTIFAIPPNHQIGSHLDPTNFLGRAPRGKFHLVLKNAIWTILNEQFFSAPFGFGSLGPDKGYRELKDVYTTWRRLFERPTGSSFTNGVDFLIFRQDKLATKWRSANFQCITVALKGSGGSNAAPDSRLAQINGDNDHQTINRIMAVLSEVAQLSNNTILSDVEDQIHQLVNVAGEIALQFGIQTAQLRLFFPKCGEKIQIGDEFQDCQDGDCYRGSICTADLVVVPGLQKIGDGRSDMTSKLNIVPCEFYSHDPPS